MLLDDEQKYFTASFQDCMIIPIYKTGYDSAGNSGSWGDGATRDVDCCRARNGAWNEFSDSCKQSFRVRETKDYVRIRITCSTTMRIGSYCRTAIITASARPYGWAGVYPAKGAVLSSAAKLTRAACYAP